MDESTVPMSKIEPMKDGSNCLGLNGRAGAPAAFLACTLPFVILNAMEVGEAIRKAAQILNEERTRPTVSYSAPSNDLGAALLALTYSQQLNGERILPGHQIVVDRQIIR